MRRSIAFRCGNRFRVKNDIEKTIYVFLDIKFINGIGEIHCEHNSKIVILSETYLFDLEHV